MIMARPLEETPILFGEDARRFLKRMSETRIISEEELEQVRQDYEFGMSIVEWD